MRVRAGDGVHYQYMAPQAAEERCISCHSEQGYRVNDILGGLSVTFDITGVRAWETVLENGVRLRITISLGMANMLPEMSLNATALVHAADKALYISKREGRNRVSCLEPHPVDSEQKKL